MQHWTYDWDRMGNLERRRDVLVNRHERFGYDAMNRLTHWAYNNNALSQRWSYAANGNLLSKPEAGTLSYGALEPHCQGVAGAVQPGPHALSRASQGAVQISHCYNAEGQRIASSDGRTQRFSVAGQVLEMVGDGARTVVRYGADRQRYQSIDYTTTSGSQPLEQVIYLGDVEYRPTYNETRRYLPGGLVVSHRGNRQGSRRWLLDDHQGSTDRIVNRFGTQVPGSRGQMSFEPFGWRRWAHTWQSMGRQEVMAYAGQHGEVSRRGYTGHEQLDRRALIHMNGRVYDPQVGRFLSADPFVQFADETQSANRYSYVFNNPLAWTDPSGYLGYREERWLRIAAAVVISVYTGGAGATAAASGTTAGWATAAGWATVGGFAAGAVSTGTFKGGVQGSVTSLAFLGVGAGLGAAKVGADSWQAAAAHAVTGGVINHLQGGKFAHGFVSAGMNKAVHSRLPTDMSPYLGGVVSAVVGGTISELSGGKFANGAVTAAMAYAFNQVLSTRNMSNAHCQDTPDACAVKVRIMTEADMVCEVPYRCSYPPSNTIASGAVESVDDLLLFPAAGLAGVGRALGAARTSAAGTAMRPYWPPNQGFSGTPVSTTLAPGTRIDRFGSELGTFASPAGTPFWARSLPPDAASRVLRTYEVLKPVSAQTGSAAPWFGQLGGGAQFQFAQPIGKLVEQGYLRRIP